MRSLSCCEKHPWVALLDRSPAGAGTCRNAEDPIAKAHLHMVSAKTDVTTPGFDRFLLF